MVLLICFNPTVKNVRRTEATNEPTIASTDTFIFVSEKNDFEVTNKVPTKVRIKKIISCQLIENLKNIISIAIAKIQLEKKQI